VSRTTGRPAEVLRGGSGIKVDGTADDGLAISTYIKGRESLLARDLPGPIYHQREQSTEFWLRAATGTSYLTIRLHLRLRKGPRRTGVRLNNVSLREWPLVSTVLDHFIPSRYPTLVLFEQCGFGLLD
jgi:hypothetical protein